MDRPGPMQKAEVPIETVTREIAMNNSADDRQAITDQIHNYCRAMDRIDHFLGYSVWHEDGTADYGPMFNGTGRAFIDWVCETHSGMLAHAHRIANILIQLDGAIATSEAYVHATLRLEQDGTLRQANVFGRYLDRWSKRDGRWAIDARVYVQDFDDIRAVGEQIVTPWGRRDRTDPSYAVLGDI